MKLILKIIIIFSILYILTICFFIFTASSGKKYYYETSKSYLSYNDDILTLHLFFDELPPEIKNWEIRTQSFLLFVYLELDDISTNSYDSKSLNISCLFTENEIIIECHDVLVFPNTINILLGYEKIKIDLSDTDIIGFEFNDSRYR